MSDNLPPKADQPRAEKNKIAIFFFIAVVAVECFGLFFGATSAQVIGAGNSSRQIEATAYIVNNENKEIANGKYDVMFAIYPTNRTDAASALGTPDWQETQKVQIRNGIMDAFLGSVTPIPIKLNFSNGEYYLGVTVGTDAEMIPRKKIGAVSLSLDALSAESIQGATIGTAAGNIVQLGANGKVDIKNLPTGTSGNTLVLSSDKRLAKKDATVSISGGYSYISVSGTELTLNQIDLGNDVSGTLSLTNGGTGTSTQFSEGSIVFAGSDGMYSQNSSKFSWNNSTEQLCLNGSCIANWSEAGIDGVGVAGYVTYWQDGNTIQAEQYLNAIRGGTGLDGSAAVNGALLIGNGSGYSLANLTQGSNIVITNGAGSITVATSATPTFSTVNGNAISTGTGTLNLSSYSLVLSGSSNINQNLLTSSSPTFAGLTTTGNILAASTAQNIGSVVNRFNYGYFQNLDVVSMTVGGVGISGSTSNVFTINSSNVTNDAEDSYLAFSRGENGGIPNTAALIEWNSTSKNFNFNFPVGILEGGASPIYHTIFQGGDQNADVTYTLPTAQATGANYILTNNGSGILAWIPVSGSGGAGGVGGSGTAGEAAYWLDGSTLTHEAYLNVGRGGTGLSGSVAANGTLLIGNGSGYDLRTLTASTGIGISNGVGTITLTNIGVTSLTGTADQITVSASSGAITLSLPQNITTASDATFHSLSLTTPLQVSSGGTGRASYTPGDLVYYASDGSFSSIGIGSNSDVLTISSGVPTWSATAASVPHNFLSAQHSDTTTASAQQGAIITGQGASPNTKWSSLSLGSAGYLLRSNGTDAVWSSTSNITTLGTITTGTWNGTNIDTAHGGTGLGAYTAGDMLYYSTGTTLSKLARGIDGQILSLASGVPAWINLSSISHSPVTIDSTANGLSIASQVLSLALSSGTTVGALSSTDWTNFNAGYTYRLTSVSGTSPLTLTLMSNALTGSIADAAADGTTKGAASFTAVDFNAASGIISLDYTNGQAASGTTKGFLTSSDWTTFNGKQATYTNLTSVGSLADAAGWLHNDGAGNFVYSIPTGTTYVAGGTLMQLSGNTFSLHEGTLTTTDICTYVSGTGLVCNQANNSTNWDAAYTARITTANSPLSLGTNSISIADAAADGTTKGAASFMAVDFNAASGIISLDYTNGQVASGTTKGFLTSSDWTTFNGKQAALTMGNLTGTSNQVTVTGGTGAIIGGGVSLSLPQSIAAISTPTFGGMTLNGTLGIIEGGSTPTKYTIFQGGDQAVDITYTLPVALGTSGQVLKTDDSGNLYWATVSGGSGGIGTVTSVGSGNGLTGGPITETGTLSISLLSANGGTASTSSYSGLQFSGASDNQLSLLQGCANNEVLSWNNTAKTWGCASVSGVGGLTGSGAANQIAYWNSANTLTGVTVGADSFLTTNGSNVPTLTTKTTDYFTQYALLAGRSGGQTLYGGSAQTETLTLVGNSATASGTDIAGGDVSIKATPGTGTGASSLHFFTGTTLTTGTTLQTSSEKMTILGSGNVGIGTTAPGNNLDVNGGLTLATNGTASAVTLRFGNTDTDTGIYYSGTNTLGIAAGSTNYNFSDAALYRNTTGGFYMPSTVGTAAAPTYSFKGYQNDGMFRHTGINDIGFSVGGVERLTIVDTTGNVGIGTTSPGKTLDVVGTIRAWNGSNTGFELSAAGLIAGFSTNPLPIKAGTTINFSTYDAGVGFSEKMTLLNNGNVGIGTTSPTAYLNIKAGTATAGTAPLKFTSSAGAVLSPTEAGAVEFDGSHLFFTAADGGTRYQLDQQAGTTYTASLPLSVASNNFTIAQATTSTDGYLSSTDWNTFNGKVATSDLTAYALLAGRAASQTLIGSTAANNTLTLQGNSAATGNTLTNIGMQFKVGDSGATNAMTILNNGNVGIGSIAPSQFLSVGATNQFTVDSAGNVQGASFNGNLISGSATLSLNTFTLTLTGNTQINQDLLTTSSVTFANVTDSALSNGVVINSAGLLGSEAQLAIARGGTGIGTAPTDGQLLIGTSGGGYALAGITASSGISVTPGSGSIVIANTGVRSLLGTTDEVNVSAASGDNVTLSLPQTIATTSSPTFQSLTLSTALSVTNGGTGLSAYGAANQIMGMNAAGTAMEYKTVSGTTDQVTVTNTANTLTFSLPQSIATTSSPSFAGLTLTGAMTLNDDQLLTIGTTGDGVIMNRSTLLTANTALSNVFVGTPVVGAIAANSTIFSNITSGSDMVFATNVGGNSTELLRLSGTTSQVAIGTGATSMTIDNNGLVGIGTTTPGQLLTVNGTLGILEGGSTPTYHTIFQGGDQAADITYTLPTGAPASNGFVLSALTDGTMSWASSNGNMSNPMTTLGDIIYGGASAGAPTRLAGSAGFLTSTGAAAPTWTAATTDYFTQYALLAGRASSQTLNGGIAQTETLTLVGNSATASGTDIAGGHVNIKATPGTGTGASSLHFFTGTTLTTGTTLQTSSEKMTILGNGNVGIGTTSPGSKLDVVSATNGVNVFNFTPSRGAYNWTMNDYGVVSANGGNGADWAVFGATLSGSGDTNNRLAFGLDSGNPFLGFGPGNAVRDSFIKRASNGAGFAITGNVGIGTTSPQSLLSVGDVNVAVTANEIALGKSASSYFRVGQDTNHSLAFGWVYNATVTNAYGVIGTYGGSNNVVIQPTGGNVGIGTTSPGAKLDIASANVITANSTKGNLSVYTTNAQAVDVGASLTLGGYNDDAASAFRVFGSIEGRKFSSTNDQSNGYLLFKTNSGGTLTEKMRITTEGNVGIGTTSPGTNLEIAGANQVNTYTPTTANLLVRTTDALAIDKGGSVGFGAIDDGSGTVRVMGSIAGRKENATSGNQSGYLAFSTNNNATFGERMRIDSVGNVGIGTTSPTNILSLGNSAAQKFWIENSATDVVGRALTVAAGGTVAGTSTSNVVGGQLILQSGLGTGTGDSSIAFQTGTTLTTGTTLQTMSTKMTILGNGNVGIGTPTPGQLLTVNGTTNSTNIFSNLMQEWSVPSIGGIKNANSAGISVGSFETGIGGRSRMDFVLAGLPVAENNYGAIPDTTVMSLNANGNVGIGTSGPLSKLSVGGVGSASVQAKIYGTGATSTTYGLVVSASGGTDNFYIRDDGYGYLRAASWAYGSDRRMKENIKDMNYGLETVTKLNPQEFDYINGQKNQLGFIAQDIQPLIPEMVSTQENGMLAIQTDMLIPILTKAIQEQQGEIQNSNDKITVLDDQILGLADNQNNIVAQLSGQLADQNLSVNDKITLIGSNVDSVSMTISQIQNDATTYKDLVSGLDAKYQALSAQYADLQSQMELIKTQNQAVIDFAIALNTKSLIYKDVLGNIDLGGGKLEAGGIVAGAFTVKVTDENKKTIGSNYIEVPSDTNDGKSYFIKTTAVTDTCVVLTNFQANPNAYSWVEKVKDDNGNYVGFRIKLSAPTAERIYFDWWIVEKQDSTQAAGTSTDVSTSAATPNMDTATTDTMTATTADAVTP